MAVVLLASAASPRAGHAQQSDTGLVYSPFVIPQAPAFTFLGTSPSEVEGTRVPRKLALALLDGVDSTGRIAQGLAFDIAPARMLGVPRLVPVTLEEYQRPGFVNPKYWWWNTSVSIGTARAEGDTASTNLAVGLRTVFSDASDEMRRTEFTDSVVAMNYRICGDSILPKDRPPSADERTALLECAKTVRQRAAAAYNERWEARGRGRWNRGGVAAAAALGWRLRESRVDDVAPLGWGAWVVGSRGFGRRSLLMTQLRYDDRRAVGTASESSTLSYGGRAIVGSARVNVFVDLVGVHHLTGDAGDDDSGKWSGGLEFRAAEQLWLATGVGTTFATRDTPDRVVIAANLRWRVFREPQFIPPENPTIPPP